MILAPCISHGSLCKPQLKLLVFLAYLMIALAEPLPIGFLGLFWSCLDSLKVGHAVLLFVCKKKELVSRVPVIYCGTVIVIYITVVLDWNPTSSFWYFLTGIRHNISRISETMSSHPIRKLIRALVNLVSHSQCKS